MKIKTIRHAIAVRIFALVLLATCGFAASANAQGLSARFTLPYEVHWGKNILPAGSYAIHFGSTANVAVIQSANGETAVFAPVPIKASSEKGPAAIFVMVRGNERMVRSLNLPARGVSFIYKPETNAERELLAKADQVVAVPVITAVK